MLIGNVLGAQEEHEEALKQYARALDIQKKVHSRPTLIRGRTLVL